MENNTINLLSHYRPGQNQWFPAVWGPQIF